MSTQNKRNFLRQFQDENNQLKELTAHQFIEIWNHYDADGNGFIEGRELDNFLNELVTSINGEDTQLTEKVLNDLKQNFMEAYDENLDGKISVYELAEILPAEENFLLIFRRDNPLESSVEFMKVWRRFDINGSGFIEADELQEFIKYLLSQKTKDVISKEKLLEYTDSILNLFDQNKDGKLQFSEMSRLIPTKENFLLRPIFKTCPNITKNDLDRVFDLYDKDGNQVIENDELDGLVKDLTELVKSEYDVNDLEEFKKSLLAGCELNNDGRINKNELKMVMYTLAKKK